MAVTFARRPKLTAPPRRPPVGGHRGGRRPWFKTPYMQLAREANAKAEQKFNFTMPSMPMVEACRADDFEFFQSFIQSGMLTAEQMNRAAERYYLGKTRSGKTMFWMIDDMMQPLDARIGDTWVSQLLKKREPLLEYWPVKHCLFGEHLLNVVGDLQSPTIGSGGFEIPQLDAGGLQIHQNNDYPVAIVESEESAVILSELFPESIWMAYSTTAHLVPELMAPLQGRHVTIYPRTDPTMSTYVFFLEYTEIVRKHYDISLRIDSTLEHNATAEQKEQCIDILEFILKSS